MKIIIVLCNQINIYIIPNILGLTLGTWRHASQNKDAI